MIWIFTRHSIIICQLRKLQLKFKWKDVKIEKYEDYKFQRLLSCVLEKKVFYQGFLTLKIY